MSCRHTGKRWPCEWSDKTAGPGSCMLSSAGEAGGGKEGSSPSHLRKHGLADTVFSDAASRAVRQSSSVILATQLEGFVIAAPGNEHTCPSTVVCSGPSKVSGRSERGPGLWDGKCCLTSLLLSGPLSRQSTQY